MQALRLWGGAGALEGFEIVVPKLGDAVDLDLSRWDVGARPLGQDVRLNIAAHTRDSMCQRRVNLVPMLDEFFVAEPVFAGQ